jgi:hypothetical protein
MECDRHCWAYLNRSERIAVHLRAVRANTPENLPTSQEIRERLRRQVLAIQAERAGEGVDGESVAFAAE